MGLALASPALAKEKPGGSQPAASSEIDGKAIRTVEIEIGPKGFSETAVPVRLGETVRFVVRNAGKVARDFTIGTQHVMDRRRAFLAKALTSDSTDIDPLQRGKLDRKNAVVVLPGETRELTWTFARTDGLEFASSIAGHYEEGFKGAFRNGPVAQAKAEDVVVEPPAAEEVEPPRKEPAAEIEAAPSPPAPATEPGVSEQAEAPPAKPADDLLSAQPAAKAAEEPKPQEKPEVAEQSKPADKPKVSEEPKASEEPKVAEEPEAAEEPEVAEEIEAEPETPTTEVAAAPPAEEPAAKPHPSVLEHARVSKLRIKGLKAKRARAKQKRRRAAVQTNFNSSRIGTGVSAYDGAGQPDRGNRASAADRAASRAYDDAQREKKNRRREARERTRFETDGYALRGREDTLVDDLIDEDPNKLARHDLTSSQFHAFSKRAAAQGYHPVYVDGYLTPGGVRFAGIWERRRQGRWIARHGLTSGEYQAMYDRFAGEGYKLIHVSGYWDGSQEKYAAIWSR